MIKNNNSQVNLRILLLGTGGTIAGLISGDGMYQAAQLSVETLLPIFNGVQYQVICEQLAQIDSKDMRFDIWEQLYSRIQDAQNDASVGAIVVTHGTDTLEETAFFLSMTLKTTKPVVLTGAMRPADAADADGPANMSDALRFAATGQAGIYVAFAGKIFPAIGVQKTHPHQLNAFEVIDSSEDAVNPVPRISLTLPIRRWPRVEIVMSYAGASEALIDALMAQKIDGIVIAGTGNGTVHQTLEVALKKAVQNGVAVVLTTRCAKGCVDANASHAFEVSALPPVKARIAMILRLLAKI